MELKKFVRANPDRVIAVGLVVVGAVAVIVGWIGVSGTGLAAEQIPYLVSGGLGGIGLIAIGCTAWISADLQDEWRRLDALEDRLIELAPGATNGADDPTNTSANGRVRSGRLRAKVTPEAQA